MQACLGPLAFFDVERGRQERGGRSQSLMNHEEVKLIFTLLNFVFHHHEPDAVGTVAVIAAYKSQARLHPFRVVNLCIVSVMACRVGPRWQCGMYHEIPHGQEVAVCLCTADYVWCAAYVAYSWRVHVHECPCPVELDQGGLKILAS